jgi:hypothetical protein
VCAPLENDFLEITFNKIMILPHSKYDVFFEKKQEVYYDYIKREKKKNLR